jgi:aspartokinase/homoserine dehydrogenase 1
MSPETLAAHAPRNAGRASAAAVELVLIGARGKVGSAFRRQFGRRQGALRDEAHVDFRLVASFDRRGFAFDPHGLVPETVDGAMPERRSGDAEHLIAHITRPGAARTLVIDCTASDEIADLYPALLAGGVGVVAANKRANARSLASYAQLQRLARDAGVPYRYETTVGAAIPVLGPLRDLRLRGERVISLQGVLSGSLSYILHRVHEGCAFSTAVAEARALGYTEPDPLEDLRAVDLGRKLLVLARECGFALEEHELAIEPLATVDDLPPDALVDALRATDGDWRRRVEQARARGERWVVLAQVDAHGGRIGLESVPAHAPFAQLKPGQNLVAIRTELQDAMPLCVSGPGAGVEITAAGVLSDVVAAATQWPRRPGR